VLTQLLGEGPRVKYCWRVVRVVRVVAMGGVRSAADLHAMFVNVAFPLCCCRTGFSL